MIRRCKTFLEMCMKVLANSSWKSGSLKPVMNMATLSLLLPSRPHFTCSLSRQHEAVFLNWLQFRSTAHLEYHLLGAWQSSVSLRRREQKAQGFCWFSFSMYKSVLFLLNTSELPQPTFHQGVIHCSVWPCPAAAHGWTQQSTTEHNTTQNSTAQHSTTQHHTTLHQQASSEFLFAPTRAGHT